MTHQLGLEVIAPTIEEALKRGLEELGVTADAVTMEVLDTGSRGFLGLGSRQVRVRLTLKPPEEMLFTSQKASGSSTAAAAATPAEEPAQSEAGEASSGAEETEPAAEADEVLSLVRQSAETLLAHMQIQVDSVDVYYDDKDPQVIHVDIHGKDLNILIGRHAEVLNAFQYILALIVGRHLERWAQIVVDVEGYRQRRQRSLERLAQRMADQAIKTGRRQMLEPMPANERRIVHLALRHREDVETLSVGEEPRRKVTIIPRAE